MNLMLYPGSFDQQIGVQTENSNHSKLDDQAEQKAPENESTKLYEHKGEL